MARQLISKIIELENEVKRQHSIKIRKRIKLATSIAAGILITTATIAVSTVSYHRKQETREQQKIMLEQQRIMLEQTKLAYASSYEDIKKSISEGQFEKADEEAANLASKLEKETFSEAKDLLGNLKIYSAYIKKFRTLEDECEKENFEVAKKLNAMLVSDLKKEQPKDDGYILFAFAEKKSSEIDAALRQINFEKGRLSAYNESLNQIKSCIDKDQFEEAKISNDKLEEIIKKEKSSFKYLTEKRDDAVDELAACTKTTKQQIKRMEEQLISAREEFKGIQAKVTRGAYDGISDNVKNLTARLEKINYSKTEELIEKVKSYTFIKSVKVDAVYEKSLVKGHLEQGEWVPGQSQAVKKISINPKDFITIPLTVVFGMGNDAANVVGMGDKDYNVLSELEKQEYTEKIKTTPGYYKQNWIPDHYEDVLVYPEYYKKIKVNPSSGKEWVIEDNAPKRLELEQKQSPENKVSKKGNYSW